ncbi:MAG: OmpA family protein [Prolixibacteraceae bacterium]|nr:OmpA family protein [Prolixibacteraceae bacterium]
MKALKFLFVFFICLAFNQVNAQIDVSGKVKNQTNNRANNKVDQGIDQGLDAVENGVKDLFKKKKKPAEEDQPAEQTAEEEKPEPQDVKPAKETKPSLQSYSKFDFIPGEKVIFYDDFTESAVGDFPSAWNTNASGEVVTTNLYPGNWFKMLGEGCIALDEGIKLPDNFTIEYDVITYPKEEDNTAFEFGFYLYSAENPKDMNEGGAVPGLKGGIKMSFGYRGTYSAYDETGYTISGEKDDAVMEAGKKYRLSFWVQKTRLRVYLDQVKIFDLPKVFKAGFKCNQMRFELWESGNPMITNFRIAAGLPDTRNKLLTEGKLVTYGIYFDVNKDIVKPESYGTLKDIATILNEVPNVKVKIFGHTDSDGDDAKNMDLSKRRAASVKAELVKSFGVKADQLETDGLGETKPVAPNDTPVNKALNRRVEFIKL